MRKLPRACLAITVIVAVTALAEDPPQPGQRPLDSSQLEVLRVARENLADALRLEDLASITTAETAFRRALGPYAGVPEDAEERWPKGTKASRPTASDFTKLTTRMNRLASGSEEARNNRMELRNAAYLAIGLLALSEAKHPDAEAYCTQAAVELDYLIGKQAEQGYFPYPIDPVAPPHLQRQAAKAALKYPDRVKGGFIYLEADGAQFDTGCCAYALAYGYHMTKEGRFLAAARKAGDWALQFPLSANWNYNAFSVWQLAKLYAVTRERQYLDGAVRIAKLGVLPGQMENGRWSDQHNAKAVYHWIMVRALVALLGALPEKHDDARLVRERTKLAIDSRVADIVRDGGGSSVHAYVALAEALDHFGPDAEWERALAEVGGISPYSAGVFARRQAASRQ